MKKMCCIDLSHCTIRFSARSFWCGSEPGQFDELVDGHHPHGVLHLDGGVDATDRALIKPLVAGRHGGSCVFAGGGFRQVLQAWSKVVELTTGKVSALGFV
jgi:hypothetical protein